MAKSKNRLKSLDLRRNRDRRATKLDSMKVLHRVRDDRVGSFSILLSLHVEEYLALAEPAYSRRGGIEGQREALATTSAVRIRNRMAADLRRGAVLPPVVLGILVPERRLDSIESLSDTAIRRLLSSLQDSSISIIDGMQRTTVLRDEIEELKGRELRVELWISNQTTSLTYRMLVLNTGQLPWNLRRQIEVINASLIAEIEHALKDKDIKIYGIDDKRRRVNPGEYQANDVVEMYIAFGLRKPQIDKESVLIDQFSRLDMIEAVSSDEFLGQFLEIFRQLVALDKAFGRIEETKVQGRFDIGRKLFDGQPACAGFVAAAAQRIFGRPGADRDKSRHSKSIDLIRKQCQGLVEKLRLMKTRELEEFLDFSTLNEVLSKGGGRIGDFERNLFMEAFRLLIEEGADLPSMTACWRAQ